MKRVIFTIITIVFLFGCKFTTEEQGDNFEIYKNINGYASKGPMQIGSDVILSDLDDRYSPTGFVFNTTTINKYGES